MAYTADRTWTTGELVTASIMNTYIRDNLSHLAGMTVGGGTALSALAAGSELGCVIGTYTGDGAATKAITGVGFQPRVVIIIPQTDSNSYLHIKTSSDGTKTSLINNNYEDDHIISLNSGGFTVGDGTGATNGNSCNVNLRVYTYIAWR